MWFPSRNQLSKGAYLALGIALGIGSGAQAQAAVVILAPDCAVSGSGWGCYLPGIFHFLLVIAIVLGVLLLAVVGVAVRSYFKIKHDEKVDS